MNKLIESLVRSYADKGIEITPDELREALYDLLAQARRRFRRPRWETNMGTLKWLIMAQKS